MFKPVRMSDSTSYVSIHDSAIDWDRAAALGEQMPGFVRDDSVDAEQNRGKAIAEFTKDAMANRTRDPAGSSAKLPILAGQKPARFVIGVIPPGELARISDECLSGDDSHEQELRWRCFCSGLRDIENWEGDPPKVKVDGVEYVDPSWIRRTFVRHLRSVALEVGFVIWAWNMLAPDEAKN